MPIAVSLHAADLVVARRLEDNGYPAATASRTHEPRFDHVLQILDFVFANQEGRVAELVFKKTGDFFCRNVPDSRPCDAQERGKMTPNWSIFPPSSRTRPEAIIVPCPTRLRHLAAHPRLLSE